MDDVKQSNSIYSDDIFMPPSWLIFAIALLRTITHFTLNILKFFFWVLAHCVRGWIVIFFYLVDSFRLIKTKADTPPELLKRDRGFFSIRKPSSKNNDIEKAQLQPKHFLRIALISNTYLRYFRILHYLKLVAKKMLFPTFSIGVIAGFALFLARVDAASADADHEQITTAALLSIEGEKNYFTPKSIENLHQDILQAKNEKEQRSLISKLDHATRSDAPLLHQQLLRRTDISGAHYKQVLKAIGASVPDSKGRFAEMDKKVDWLNGLLSIDWGAKDSSAKRVYAESLYSVGLARALANSERIEAATTLLRFAYMHRGAFRDECGRLLRKMGSYALPGLVRAAAIDDPEAYRMKRYADYQLDRMNRARPELALKKAETPVLRAELLRAYGEMRLISAVKPTIARTHSKYANVRQAARWATMRYISGRKPKVIKRKLTLTGGRLTQRERTLYLNYRQLAVAEIVQRYASLVSKQTQEDVNLKRLKEEYDIRELALKLFSLEDKMRMAKTDKQLEDAFLAAERGDLERALKSFDRLLIWEPQHIKKNQIARFYLRAGRRYLVKARYLKSIRLLTKSLHLFSPRDIDYKRAKVLRLVAEARRELDRGEKRRAKARLRLASQILPSNDLVHSELKKLEKHERKTNLIVFSSLGLFLAGSLGVWLAMRRKWKNS